MTDRNIEITPSITVHALLDAYPELEEVLISIAPPFKKLRNPILRRTVAKVATLKHAASVGGVPIDELISKLRKTVGQSELTESFEDQNYFGAQPNWFANDRIIHSINEAELKDKNKMPITYVLKKAKDLNNGEIIELITSFLPAPGLDVMKNKGYAFWVNKESDKQYKSYFLKQKGQKK